jgi:hypothetical protein
VLAGHRDLVIVIAALWLAVVAVIFIVIKYLSSLFGHLLLILCYGNDVIIRVPEGWRPTNITLGFSCIQAFLNFKRCCHLLLGSLRILGTHLLLLLVRLLVYWCLFMGITLPLGMLSTDEGILVVVCLEPWKKTLLFCLLFIRD